LLRSLILCCEYAGAIEHGGCLLLAVLGRHARGDRLQFLLPLQLLLLLLLLLLLPGCISVAGCGC
jgi:hypothetical protein